MREGGDEGRWRVYEVWAPIAEAEANVGGVGKQSIDSPIECDQDQRDSPGAGGGGGN